MKLKLPAFVFAIALLLIPFVQVQSRQTQQTKTIRVNGRIVEGILVGGRPFVSVDDLAQQLNGSIAYQGEEITVRLPSPSVPQAESGKIRGTLTYYFNANSGNRPDSGAKIWLVQEAIEVPCGGMFLGDASQSRVGGKDDEIVTFDYPNSTPRKYPALRKTIADGNGNFEFGDLPPGEYTLILESGHVSGQCQRDVGNKVTFSRIVIQSGQTTDKSHDFGISYH